MRPYIRLMLPFLVSLSTQAFAQSFTITPDRDLPQFVPEFGKVSAYYTVTNKSMLRLNENTVKKLPKNVTQVTCDPNYCGKTFNLGPNGSSSDTCILKLTIKGPVNAAFKDLLICTKDGISCNGTHERLMVQNGPSVPFVGIGAGGYSNHIGGFFPLLVETNDNGNTWSYPKKNFQDLDTQIDPSFTGGFLAGAACTGSESDSLCVAPGQWCSGPLCEKTFPLVTVGTENNTNWFYPTSIFQNLQTTIDPNLSGGYLSAASCFGTGKNGVCIASGLYITEPDVHFPLLALTSNGGKK